MPLDMLTLACTSVEDDTSTIQTGARMATLLRLKSEIEDRLCDSNLTAADYAKRAGVSARYANKLLEEENTTLRRYIFSRRLERSRLALEDPDLDDHSISKIAHIHGFSSSSHFTRKFKAAFDMSPTECRDRRPKTR